MNMSVGDLHQSSGMTPEPSTASSNIKGESVEYVNQKSGTLHVEKTQVLPWKDQEGNSFNCISQYGDTDFIACENCSEERNNACAFCCTCVEFLCTTCHESHKRLRKLSQHNIITFDKEAGKQLQSVTKAVEQLCPQPNHNGNLTHYCESCKCLICQDCTDGVHKGHKNFPLPSGEKGDQSESEKNIALVCAQDIMKKLSTATEIDDSMIQQLEIQKQIFSQDINHAFERLQQTLKLRKNALLSKLEDITAFKVALLVQRKKKCERMAHNTKQYTELVSRGQIAVAHTELQSIQLAVDSHGVPHDEEMTLKVLLQFNEIPKQLSQLGDVLGFSPSPSNSVWFSASVAKVNVSYRVEVETRNTNNEKYTCGGLKLIAKLTSKAYRQEFVITGLVDDYGDGKYTVTFNVSAAGTYQLQILMDGQHIKRSPSDVEVVANYAYFSLLKVISVSNPLCVALDNEGNIYAGNSNSVFILDNTGQLKKQIPGFGNVYSICVHGDVVFVADYNNNCIKKLTPTGEVISTISSQVNKPHSVVLDGHNRIIVSDSGNNRIQIYDENGVWLSHIDGANNGFSAPRCIALDPQGNIHVACNLNAILVFTPQGTLYRMYGDVKNPLGIAIDKEGYSIVCEAGGRLTVFHPHGNKVYSTQPNPHQPMVQTSCDISSPQGIALDSNGDTLYVANSNDNILVYSVSKSM